MPESVRKPENGCVQGAKRLPPLGGPTHACPPGTRTHDECAGSPGHAVCAQRGRALTLGSGGTVTDGVCWDMRAWPGRKGSRGCDQALHPAVEEPVTCLRGRGHLPDLLRGVEDIHHLPDVRDMVFCQSPEPWRAIAHHDHVPCTWPRNAYGPPLAHRHLAPLPTLIVHTRAGSGKPHGCNLTRGTSLSLLLLWNVLCCLYHHRERRLHQKARRPGGLRPVLYTVGYNLYANGGTSMAYLLHCADCLEWLDAQPEGSFEAIVTDPPYGLKEYSDDERDRLNNGKHGGIWRMPPAIGGTRRSPLPRFTVLREQDLKDLYRFFRVWGRKALRVVVPGAHMFIATNTFLSHLLCSALIAAGWEKRGEIVRLVQTLRGGDRPKNAEEEFSAVSVMPRSAWEPWELLRKPLEGRVQDNLRRWRTGGLRRDSPDRPFTDMIQSERTPQRERDIVHHPSLKPQKFMRYIVRASLPLAEGRVLDPFMGGGATIAAAEYVGYPSVGVEVDQHFYHMAVSGVPMLAQLYPAVAHVPETASVSAVPGSETLASLSHNALF